MEASNNNNNVEPTPADAMEVDQAPRPEKMFALKKWNAVAMWRWDVECDTCAICRAQVMGEFSGLATRGTVSRAMQECGFRLCFPLGTWFLRVPGWCRTIPEGRSPASSPSGSEALALDVLLFSSPPRSG